MPSEYQQPAAVSYDQSLPQQMQQIDPAHKPFTAVFVPGQPTQFKLGTPGDFSSGSYTTI